MKFFPNRSTADQLAVDTIEKLRNTPPTWAFFSEEADVENQCIMGNIPQTFVHASFIEVIIGLKHEMEKNERILQKK